MITNFTVTDGILPVRATKRSAAYDLFAKERTEVLGVGLIKLGLFWNPTIDAFAKIFDKSGLAVKHSFSTLGGVIDPDYTLEWGVIYHASKPMVFQRGDKIAQFVLLPFLVADDLVTLDVQREGGFGSTGK